MGKVTEVVIDTKGNLVEVKSKPDAIKDRYIVDVETGTLKTVKPKKRPQAGRMGRTYGKNS